MPGAGTTPTPSPTPVTGSFLYLFGSNQSGQLGQDNTVSVSSAIQVIGGGNDWIEAVAGSNFTAVVKNDGSLWVWGANTDGQLGNNSSDNTSSPIIIPVGTSSWMQISAGKFNIAGILKG